MLQIRIVLPPKDTDEIVEVLGEQPGVAGICVQRGASVRPAGDVVTADVARESVEVILRWLQGHDIHHTGSIALTHVDTMISHAAEEAERRAPGEGADAVIWEEVVRRTSEDAQLSVMFVLFLTLGVILAGIAVVTDSPILVIGAMVVGPDFAPMAAIAVGLARGRLRLLRQATATLLVGFVVGVAVVTVLALLARAYGWITAAQLDQPRPLTEFIWRPDKWSFVVAFVAGIAGTLSLTSSKSTALTGVFISVTTIPAAANFAVALALGDPGEMGGSAAQLGINIGAIVLAGVVTLLVQRAFGPGEALPIRRSSRGRVRSSPRP